MPNARTEIPWDDATDEEREAVINLWWAKIHPRPGTDEFLVLLAMSTTDMGFGDPDDAQRQLVERGLLRVVSEHRSEYTEEGGRVFLDLYARVYSEDPAPLAVPTLDGTHRHPPSGFFRTDFYAKPVVEPCTCTPGCADWCDGVCGCAACGTRYAVYSAPGSACGEQ